MTTKLILAPADVRDQAELWDVSARSDVADARVFTVRKDTVHSPDGTAMVRSYLHHPGAVAVIAVDDEDRVAVVRQYRHPVGMRLIEPPAGLLDVGGEDYLAAAQRELAEEAELQAEHWRVLVDVCATPGSSQESIRVFLATGLSAASRPAGFVVEHEEAHMDVAWITVDDLVRAALAGSISSPSLLVGILALWAARTRDGVEALRPADAPWPARDAKDAQDRHAG